MNFGKADRYISILYNPSNKEIESQNDYSTLYSAWAKRIFNSGIETVQAEEKVGIQNCIYEVRYFPGIEQYMILFDRIDNTLWDITSMEEIGREDFVRLICYKKDNQ